MSDLRCEECATPLNDGTVHTFKDYGWIAILCADCCTGTISGQVCQNPICSKARTLRVKMQ